MAGVIVRPAFAGDRAAFIDAALASWRNAYVGVLSETEVNDAPAMLARAWERRAPAFRLAEVDGAIGGFYSLGDPAKPGDANYLWHLYVDPAMQRRGVGRALNDAALAEIASRGARTAWLDVLTANAKARAFYAALGWRETRMETGGYDVVIMECDVT